MIEFKLATTQIRRLAALPYFNTTQPDGLKELAETLAQSADSAEHARRMASNFTSPKLLEISLRSFSPSGCGM